MIHLLLNVQLVNKIHKRRKHSTPNITREESTLFINIIHYHSLHTSIGTRMKGKNILIFWINKRKLKVQKWMWGCIKGFFVKCKSLKFRTERFEWNSGDLKDIMNVNVCVLKRYFSFISKKMAKAKKMKNHEKKIPLFILIPSCWFVNYLCI